MKFLWNYYHFRKELDFKRIKRFFFRDFAVNSGVWMQEYPIKGR